MEKMTAGRFRHMPVMEEGRLVGVISIGDVVKARMSEMEMENRAMEEMIKGN
jgi:signal-transduction protein with cAMP-binding, CBS, and nucleotidyltransferase domain